MSGQFGCVGNTIKLRSGIYFDLADPKPEMVSIEDIAGALAKICRFGGQCGVFYSVAEHSAMCARQASRDRLPVDAVKAIILHDAAEAYVGDMVKPLKIMLPQFTAIESAVESAIEAAFGVDFHFWKPQIREIDHAMLIAERRYLFDADGVTWAGENEARTISPQFLLCDPVQAERLFMLMWLSLQ